MRELTKNTNKSLLKVNDKPILSYMVHFAGSIGSDRIIVVGRYFYEKVKQALQKIDPEIEALHNREQLNHSLSDFEKALESVEEGSVLVCNADYIFMDSTVENVKKYMQGISVYCSYDLSGDNEDVMRVLDKNGVLVEMSKQLTSFNSIYTGIWYVSEDSIPLVEEVIQDIFKKHDRKEASVELIFRELVVRGEIVLVQDVGPANWFEFDTPEDLERARIALLKKI